MIHKDLSSYLPKCETTLFDHVCVRETSTSTARGVVFSSLLGVAGGRGTHPVGHDNITIFRSTRAHGHRITGI